MHVLNLIISNHAYDKAISHLRNNEDQIISSEQFKSTNSNPIKLANYKKFIGDEQTISNRIRGFLEKGEREREVVSGRAGLTVAEPSDFRQKRGGFRLGWVSQDVAGLRVRLSAVEREKEGATREERSRGRDTWPRPAVRERGW